MLVDSRGAFHIIMAYQITGIVTYASQANRDAARTRVNTALSGYSYTNVTTSVGTGIANVGTTQISFSVDVGQNETLAAEFNDALHTALTQSNRQTSGWVSVNKI